MKGKVTVREKVQATGYSETPGKIQTTGPAKKFP